MYKILPNVACVRMPDNNPWRFAMRVSFFYIVLLFATIQVLLAHTGKGQTLDDVKVEVALQDQSLRNLFEYIEAQTAFKFVYSIHLVDPFDDLVIPRALRSVRETLDLALFNTNLSYEQSNGNILIFPTADRKGGNPIANVPAGYSQHGVHLVSGVVTEAFTGRPMAGVNVLIKGSLKGTSTDFDGRYYLDAAHDDVLVFSFIGFETFETAIAGRTLINVNMDEDINALEEVVVNAGYYTITERLKTGNIARVSAEEISRQIVSNPLAALQGRMTGVYIQQSSGIPGAAFNILIRGQNSLRTGGTTGVDGNLPLYVVDGVPFPATLVQTNIGASIIGEGSPLSSLNPADIESIEILKDADATAIYGSRGGNGVILVTTRKWKEGSPRVEVGYYSGVGAVANQMKLLNTKQYLHMREEAFDNDGAEPGTGDYDLNGTWGDNDRYTNWQKKLIGGTAFLSNLHTSISGGNKVSKFFFGVDYYNETTVFPDDFDYNRFSTKFNVRLLPFQGKLSLDFYGSYGVQDNNLLSLDLTTTALTLPPVAPELYDEQGDLNWENGNFENPAAQLNKSFHARTSTLVSNIVADYSIFEDLSLKSNFGYTETRIDELALYPIGTFNPYGNITTGSSNLGNSSIRTWIVEPQLNYQHTFFNGVLRVMLGSTFQESLASSVQMRGEGYTSDALLENVQAAPIAYVSNYDKSTYRYNAVFGRINYQWKDKYIINITGRRDGSSRFGPGRRFANFGAVGIAWIFSEEDFAIQALPFLNFGKLRISYGTTGSDQIGNYKYFELWNPLNYTYDGTTGLTPENLYNANFAWEANQKMDVGLELGLLADRLNLSVDYFLNYSDNQLVGIPLPGATGFSSVQSNFPARVRNSGIEIQWDAVDIKHESFVWKTFFNITLPDNKLVSFPGIENTSFRDQYKVGKSLGVDYALNYQGVAVDTGLYTFEDVNGDGRIRTVDDGRFLKEISQAFFGGCRNNFSYKGFELDFFFQFVKQTGSTYLNYFDNPGGFTNQPSFVQARWQQPGDKTNIQMYTQSTQGVSSYLDAQRSSDRVGNASFVRLKNASLSYHIPQHLLNRIKVHDAKFFIQAQNVFTMTHYRGLDPETQTIRLPPLRMFSMGTHITF